LINVGDFNIIVLPDVRQYFILGEDEESFDVQNQFIQGQSVAYGRLNPLWFQYGQDESWRDFEQKPYRLGQDVSEDELINMYVLKKFNFGSLVAVRDSEGGKVKVFKRDMLKTRS
jgi:hypothetical protein